MQNNTCRNLLSDIPLQITKKTFINYGSIAAKLILFFIVIISLLMFGLFIDVSRLWQFRGMTCQVEGLSSMKTSPDGLVSFYNANVSIMGYSVNVEWNEFCKSATALKAETCKKFFGNQFPCFGLSINANLQDETIKNQDFSLMSNREFATYIGNNVLLFPFIGLLLSIISSIMVAGYVIYIKYFKNKDPNTVLFSGYFDNISKTHSIYNNWNEPYDKNSIFGNVNQRNIVASEFINNSDEELRYHEFNRLGGLTFPVKLFYISVAIVPFVLFSVISILTSVSMVSIGVIWFIVTISILISKELLQKSNVNTLITNMRILIVKVNGWKVEIFSVDLSAISKAWSEVEEDSRNDESHLIGLNQYKLCVALKDETNSLHGILLERTNNPQVYIDAINKFNNFTEHTNQPKPFLCQENPTSLYPSFNDYEMNPYN